MQSLETRYPAIHAQLERLRGNLEAVYNQPCEIEFVIESGRLYVLQVRPARMTAGAHARAALERLATGEISLEEAIHQIPANFVEHALAPRIVSFDGVTEIARGLPGSAGAATGVAAFSGASALQYAAAGARVILVIVDLTPDLFDVVEVVSGLLTTRGGFTSHAAVAARGRRRPCVVGAESIKLDPHDDDRAIVGGHVINAGDAIAIDGSSGRVYLGTPAIDAKWWWEDEVAPAVAALVENTLRVGSEDDDVLLKCWRFRDAFMHHDVKGFGLSSYRKRVDTLDTLAVTDDIAELCAHLRELDHATGDTICTALSCLIDGVARVLRQRAGIGEHPTYFRPLWDPTLTRDEYSQIVGFEYFGINRLVPFWIDLANIKIVLQVTLADGLHPWKLDRTNPRGASLSPGSGGVIRWVLWINDSEINPDDLTTLVHFVRSREYSWKWFDANVVTHGEIRQFLRLDAAARRRNFRLYQKCLQLGLISNDVLSTAGESLVTEINHRALPNQTTDEIVESATARATAIISAVIERGYAYRPVIADNYGELIRQREFREAVITELYESHFSPDRHEFDYALIRELVESLAALPAVAYVAGAVTAGVVGNAAYDVIKRLAHAIAAQFQDRDPARAEVWRGMVSDLDRIKDFFEHHSIATSDAIADATGIEREKLLPLLKLLGFTYQRGKGRNGWAPGSTHRPPTTPE